MKGLLQILHPAPFMDVVEDDSVIKKRYRHWRIRMFLSIYLGYVVYYFTRRSFSSILPILGVELGWDNSSLGIMLSVMAFSYGLSKFVSGLMGDKSNARYFMAIGLVLTGVINIIFGLSFFRPYCSSVHMLKKFQLVVVIHLPRQLRSHRSNGVCFCSMYFIYFVKSFPNSFYVSITNMCKSSESLGFGSTDLVSILGCSGPGGSFVSIS